MCGVIGVWLSSSGYDDVQLVDRVFRESMIRGKHATGVSYIRDNQIHTIKEGIPCDKFLERYPVSSMVNEDGGIYLIGHIRYSTSDLRYNQPFSNGEQSIVHNGVISQEDMASWKYPTETANDSELILKSIEAGENPLTDFNPASMAVCVINKDKQITAFRNESRPLWFSRRNNGVVFASTKNILERSFMENISPCRMYRTYTYNGSIEESSAALGGEMVRDLQCA